MCVAVTGPLCQVCKDPSTYFERETAMCHVCPENGPLTLWLPFTVISVLLVVFWLLLRILETYRDVFDQCYWSMMERINPISNTAMTRHKLGRVCKRCIKFFVVRSHDLGIAGILKLMVTALASPHSLGNDIA